MKRGLFSVTCASDSMKSGTSLIVWMLSLYTIIIIAGVHKRQYTTLVYLIIITIPLLLVMMIVVTRCTSTASWSTSCKQRKAVTRLLLAATCTRWEFIKKNITGKTLFGAKCNGISLANFNVKWFLAANDQFQFVCECLAKSFSQNTMCTFVFLGHFNVNRCILMYFIALQCIS